MRDKLNLLLLTPFPPCGGFNAGRTRIFETVKRFSRNHNVSIISFVSQEDERFVGPLKKICYSLEIVPFLPREKSPFLRWDAGIIARFYSDELRKKFHSHLRRGEFDIVQFEYLSMSQYLPRDIMAPSVLTLHELDILSLWRDVKFAPRIADRITALPKLCKIGLYYRHILGRFNRIVVFTQKEKDILHRVFPRLSVAVVPMGVDTAYLEPLFNGKQEIDLLYIGYFRHRPNIDAICYFCRKILPLIRKYYPAIKLSIVGRYIPDTLRPWQERGCLDIIGEADAIRSYFMRAKVFVMPIITGAGMRGKLLEAFSMEKAVVSTSIGHEGIGVKDGENILIANTPKEFARKVIVLLNDSKLRRKLGRNARETVESGYSWDYITKRTLGEFHELIYHRSNL